jgi:hypothetical protein
MSVSYQRGFKITPTAVAGPGSNSPQFQQFLNRLVTLPSAPRQALYSSLINSLVPDGTLSALDALWVAGADIATNLTSLVSGTFAGVVSGAPTFTVDRGFTCNNSVNIITTNFNPSAGGQNFSQNSASFGAWNLTSFTPSFEVDLLRLNPGAAADFLYIITGPQMGAQLNSSGAAQFASTGSTGWVFGNRSSSSLQTISQNNTQLGTNATASTTPDNGPLLWWGNSVGQQFAAVSLGGSLSSGQQTTLYTALQTYLHAIGAV